MTGIIHGKTIELDEAPGLADGQRVEIEVKSTQEESGAEAVLRRCAGSLADMPDSVDADLQAILDARKDARFREVGQ
jgi:hypothetical protein